MDLSKLYNFKHMNSYQFIAVVGLIMSVGAHFILWFQKTEINDFWALYICWATLYIAGSVINYRSKPDEGHHHHHHH